MTEPDSLVVKAAANQIMRWSFRLWGFGEAIGLRGLLAMGARTGDLEPLGFVHALLRAWLGRGVANSPADHVGPGRELLYFYHRTGEDVFLSAARRLAELHRGFPANRHGARMHRPDQPGWCNQIWVDCMDNEPPFLAQLGVLSGDERYFSQAAEELVAYARSLQDEQTGLFFHGFESSCGRNGQCWARGNGWALLGLIETLTVLPPQHSLSGELRQRLVALCEGLARHQLQSGLWPTVITIAETYSESSLAVMVAYGLREALAADLLDAGAFGEMERRARSAVKGRVDSNGALQLVSGATPVGEPQVYASRPFGIFPWGQGPLLLMLAQEEIKS